MTPKGDAPKWRSLPGENTNRGNYKAKQPPHGWYVVVVWKRLKVPQTYFVRTKSIDYRLAARRAQRICGRKTALVMSLEYSGVS